jgi:hypothetical protein
MNTTKRVTVLLSVLCLFASLAQANKHGRPDAVLHLNSGAFAAGVGISWGKGTLTYKGKEYEVSVKGLSLGKVGISKVTATGEVYRLKSLADFDGNYTTANADITLAEGHSGLVMKNQNGVHVVISATTKGVDLTLGGSGVEMHIKK